MRRPLKCERLEDRDLLTFAFNYQIFNLPIDESHSAVDMEVVDLNGDAHLDLIVATHLGSSHIDAFLGTGSGYRLTSRELLAGRVLGTSQVDLDGDGNEDLVVHTNQGIVSYLDKGKLEQEWLGFESANMIALADVWNLEPANINGDQFGDLLAGVDDEIHVMLGNGDGTFSDGSRIVLSEYRPPLPEGLNRRYIVDQSSFDVGDINSDGFDDLVVSAANEFLNLGNSSFLGVVVSLINDGQGSFTTKVYEGEAGSVFLEDIDRDGDLDFLVSSYIESPTDFVGSRVLHGDGHGSFALNEADCCVIGQDRIEAADGTRIYMLQHQWGGGGDVLFLENENVAIDLHPWNHLWPHPTTQFADLDSDGTEEIVALSHKGVVVLRKSDPSPLIESEPIRIPTGEQLAKLIDDFDLDGHIDIVAIDAVDGKNELSVRIRWGTPSGPSETLDSFVLDLGITDPQFNGDLVLGKIKDVNDDGFPDIKVRVRGGILNLLNIKDRGLEVGPLENDGSVFPFDDSEIPLTQLPLVVANGDVNGDGFSEKVTVYDTWYDGLLTIQRGVSESEVEGVGVTHVFSKPFDVNGAQYQKAVLLLDMTGDGILDVVYSDFAAADVFVFAGISDQATGDVNGDSKVDFADFLILSDNFGKEVAKWSDGDFDGDSRVGFSDFLILNANFGSEIA